MPQNTSKATEVWNRFNYKRDSGHDDRDRGEEATWADSSGSSTGSSR